MNAPAKSELERFDIYKPHGCCDSKSLDIHKVPDGVWMRADDVEERLNIIATGLKLIGMHLEKNDLKGAKVVAETMLGNIEANALGHRES